MLYPNQLYATRKNSQNKGNKKQTKKRARTYTYKYMCMTINKQKYAHIHKHTGTLAHTNIHTVRHTHTELTFSIFEIREPVWSKNDGVGQAEGHHESHHQDGDKATRRHDFLVQTRLEELKNQKENSR